MRKWVSIVLCTALLAGCAAPGQPGYAPAGEFGQNKTTGGALVGAGLGGLAGSQIGHGSGKLATTLLGVVLGGVIGGSVGASLDRADQAALENSTQHALETAPSHQPVAWQNPDSGHHGTIIPSEAYREGSTYCREYQQTIVVNGQTQQAYGRACRQPDGSWRIQS